MELDNLSYLSIENQIADFPTHFHETYCISFIHKGIEQLNLGNRTHYSEAGNVTITHPFEVHSQPVFNSDTSLGFDTIYLTEDLMKYHAKSTKPLQLHRKINDPKTASKLLNLRNAIEGRAKIEEALKAFIESLLPHTSEVEFQQQQDELRWLSHVKEFIEHNISSKISLDELASIANINKYGFSKIFKTSTGMTPINYVLMQKVFSAKKRLTTECNLTLLAYEFDFTDLAHFSKTFKRFIGISPQAYKNNLR